MKKISPVLLTIGMLLEVHCAAAPSINNFDLSTRDTGVPPVHQTVSSAEQWMQNPVDLQLEVAVTNLYADTNAYLEIDFGAQKKIFYGAGVDSLGNYIPTNYPPVDVEAAIRRHYHVNIVCPNSGPDGSPLFNINRNDFSSPDYFVSLLTNETTDPVSAFLWTNFTAQGQYLLTNSASSDAIIQTNLIQELNRVITGGSIYDSQRFTGVTLQSDTTNLLAQNPQGQQLVLLNRLLLRDAYYSHYGYYLPSVPSQHDNSGTAQITFYVKPPPEMKITRHRPPPQYFVLISGPNTTQLSDGSAQVNLLNSGDGSLSENYPIVQVSKAKYAHFAVGDGCDDATKAPGQGTWLSLGPGCTGDTNRISWRWQVSLGRTFDGLAAGLLSIRESGLSRDSYTPYAIYYDGSMTNLFTESPLGTTDHPFVPTNIYTSVTLVTTNISIVENNANGQVYTNYDDLLRQVKSCQTFVDILTPDTNQTVLNFYLSSQVGTNRNDIGLYTNITGTPFVTWTIQNPDPGTTNQLLIIENRSGNVSTQSLVKVASAGGVTWTLTQGSGAEQRVETRQVSFVGSPPTDRIEWDTVKYANSSTPDYQCRETYHSYPWGWELKETRIPCSPADLVTTYEYYDDTSKPYGNYGYGQLDSIVYPDGYWEKRIYEPASAFYNDLENTFESWGIVNKYYGLLCYVLHPRPDVAASVSDNLTPANSLCTGYLYSLSGGRIQSQESVTFCQVSNGIVYPDVEYNYNASEGESEGPCDYYDDNVVINLVDEGKRILDSYRYSDNAPIGLAGHMEYEIPDSGLTHYHYFDHGTFDPVQNTFDLNPTNHLYSFNCTNRYPDHRDTDFYWSAGSQNIQYWLPGAPETGDYYSALDGHPSPTVYLYARFNRKTEHIYHDGSLTLDQNYSYLGLTNQWLLLDKIRYYNDSLGRATNVTVIDPVSGRSRVIYTADYRGAGGYDGPLLLSETDENGRTTTYSYDSLQRVKTMVIKGYGSQPDQTFTYTYNANGCVLSRIEQSGALSASESWQYDLSGQVTNHTTSSGGSVASIYSADRMTVTNVYPGGITVVHSKNQARQDQSLEGTGVVPQYYSYSYDTDGHRSVGVGTQDTFISALLKTDSKGHLNSPRWRLQASDMFNNIVWREWPTGASVTNVGWQMREFGPGDISYNDNNNSYQPWETVSSSGETVLYGYDLWGKTNFVGINTPRIQDFSQGRIHFYVSFVDQVDGIAYEVTTNFAFLTDNSSDLSVQSIRLKQLNGFTGDETARTIDYDVDTNETITTTYIDRANNEATVVTSKPDTSSLDATTVYQNGRPISSSTLSVATPTLYFYDDLGRTNQIQSPLGYSTYMTYDPDTGWLTSMTDPAGNTTSYSYYGLTEANAGKLKCQTDASGTKTYYTYTSHGELYRTWGDVPYPAEYHYSEYGDLTNLITFRGGSGWTGSTWPADPGTGDNTYWIYDDASGALLKKIDAQGHATTYTYYPQSGRLFTRSRQRSGVTVIVTNLYDTTSSDPTHNTFKDDGSGYGDLLREGYNDGTPSVAFNNYNRAGLPRQIIDATGTNDLVYDYANRLVSISGENGMYAGITVSNHFDPHLGRDMLKVTGLSSPLEDDFMYDDYGRLDQVSSGVYSATYGYLPDSDLLQSTTCYNNGNPVLTTTRSWQYGFRLGSIANTVNGNTVTSHVYTYDELNRRTKAVLADGSYWRYDYNDRNELTGAHRYWPDMKPTTGQQYGYAYDNIGNRQSATFGGDDRGGDLQTISYTANDLNQYTSITTPGCKEIIGVALATNDVTVNDGLADRRVEYFHREISVDNTNQPVWQNVTNVCGTFTNKGGAVFPAHSQTLQYDENGNLTFDGVWNYQWDGENRLISMWMANTIANIANSNILKLDFKYDYMGRRVQKVVSTWNGSTFANPVTNNYVYDGWNLIAVFNPQSSVLQSFMWGNDLSGTMTQAGGVGGLLMADISNTNCFPAYDGNGNITALISAADQSTAARYEYSPYGQLIRATGPLAKTNPFRFSTKFWDEESGLVYYNYRFYSPQLGRWINRDPGWEKDGINLYGFTRNSPIGAFDRNGKETDGEIFFQALEWKEHVQTLLELISDPLEGLLGFEAEIVEAPFNPLNPTALEMDTTMLVSEYQSARFMRNAQNIITSRVTALTAKSAVLGEAVGKIAAQINKAGGNGDDFILDAALNAAATSGVDSAETIWGVATEFEY